MLDAGCWILDTRYWMVDAGNWMLDTGHCECGARSRMLDASGWKLVMSDE